MRLRVLILAAALSFVAVPAYAQVVDTAAAIRRLQEEFQSGQLTPELLRARLEAAGLTVEDVRERLRQAGYPENLLDEYLGEGPVEGIPRLSASQVESVLLRLSIPPLDPAADSLFRQDTLALDSLLLDTLAMPAEMELPVFGRNLFERATTQFQPVTMGPVPPNYRLGPGDQLVLILTGDVQQIHELPVTREGFVVIPNVGRVSVNGLTLEELRNALYTYLGRVYSGVRRGPEATTFFEVSIASLRRNQVFVIGEVERPGQYEVTSVSSALDALYQAGGPAEHGSFRNVQIRRGDRVIANLDIYEYLREGGATGDITLNHGDVVFVPVRGRRVEIDGNVVRPGIYELKGGEGLRALMELAGGIEPEADLRRVQIDRILPPNQRSPGVHRSLFDVNLAQLLDAEGELIALEPGDKVHVFAVPETRRNTVTIRGNVWTPGVYGFSPGLTVRELIDWAGGLKDDTYLGRGQILRLDPIDLTRRVVPFSLAAGEAPELREYDEVIVYSVADFQAQHYVTIFGAVQNPGVYEYHEDMSLRDLVLMAGGLRDDAYVEEADVSRLAAAPDRPGALSEVMHVRLDSSYVVSARLSGRDVGNGNGAAAAPEFALERYDNVFIRRRPGWEEQRTVAISGEVRFPGRYPLRTKDDDLGSLVERAGGLTSDAYAEGTRFFRIQHVIGDPEPHLVQLNVDLPEILEYPSARNRVILADGDSIHIPEYTPTVQVDGAVLHPTSVLYESGVGLDYYIAHAGGYARDADSGRTRVEYANGSIRTVGGWLFFKSKPEPKPGSRVFVPAKPPRVQDGIDLRSLVTILTGITTMVIVISRQ